MAMAMQDGPSVEALESQAARQARELEELLTRVAEEAESSSLKNGMEDDETLLSALSREGGGLTLVTSGGEGSLSKNMQLPQPDGPNPVTPDPKAAPSLWGTSAFEAFEGMLTPVKKHVRQQVKRIQQKVEDKVGLLLASQAQGKAHGDEEGQWDDCASGRIVLTEDGHSYEGGLDKNGAMHGYGVLRWSDGHCFQGGFREGETWGAGRRRWASGHCYTGEEQRGLKQGLGVFVWPSGRRYEGRFDRDLRSGDFGIMSWPGGRWYAGGWLGGAEHGEGLECEGEASQCYFVVYRDGQLQRKESLAGPHLSPNMMSLASSPGCLAAASSGGRRRGGQVASQRGQQQSQRGGIAVSDGESSSPAAAAHGTRLGWGLEVIAGTVVAVPPVMTLHAMSSAAAKGAGGRGHQQQQQQQHSPAVSKGMLSEGDALMSPPVGSRSSQGDEPREEDEDDDEDEECYDEDDDESSKSASDGSGGGDGGSDGAVEKGPRLSTEAIMLAMMQGTRATVGDDDDDDDDEGGGRLLAEQMCAEQEQVATSSGARGGGSLSGTVSTASSSRGSARNSLGEADDGGDAQFMPSQQDKAAARGRLIGAARGGNAEVLLAAIDDGACVDAKDPCDNDNTPLHLAARQGFLDCVCLLLEAGADANAHNGFMDTPVHAASTAGHCHVIEALANGGGDIDRTSEDGETPLHCAAYAGQARACKLLATLGADVDCASLTEQDTPLHRAALVGHHDVVEALLRARADPSATNCDGLTALDVADLRMHSRVVSILKAAVQIDGDIGCADVSL